jgi:hypothetical protein
MKALIFTSCIVLSLAQRQCNRNAAPTIPSCVQARIDSIKQQPVWNPPAEVTEYKYNGQRVFLFSSNCCDQYNEVVDQSCNSICAPSGGITGKGDRRCLDFNEKATLVKVVWKDERSGRTSR